MTDKKIKKAYFVGVKGVAMSGLALILKKQGWQVDGSDVKKSFITKRLLDQIGLKAQVGFRPENIRRDLDLVVYSASHQGRGNVEVKEALRRGIRVVSEARLIADIAAREKKVVAVAGCHGKTTTASLLAFSLIKLNQKPSYLVGTSSFNDYPAADYNKTKESFFVVEADEYAIDPTVAPRPKFSLLSPQTIILTNVDYDHVDIYPSIEAVRAEFTIFIKRLAEVKGRLIFNEDDRNSQLVASVLPKTERLSYGFSSHADLRILDRQTTAAGSMFSLSFRGKAIGSFKVNLFGEKNILNTTAVILFLLDQGFSSEKIRRAIKDFAGAKRRFEKIYEKNSSCLFDDYGHHPAEIKATIEGVRARFPRKKLLLIFQPHTYSRTRHFKKALGRELSRADQTIILPIFSSSREKRSDFKVSAQAIVRSEQRRGRNNLTAVADRGELLSLLSSFKNRKNWLILTMGAGDVYRWKDDIIRTVWPT